MVTSARISGRRRNRSVQAEVGAIVLTSFQRARTDVFIAVLALSLALTGCASEAPPAGSGDPSGVARVENALPLFSADKKKGVSAFVAATRDLNPPPALAVQGKECEEFVADLLAGRDIETFQPNYAVTTLDQVLAIGQLDRCPRTIFHNAAPPFPMNFQHPSGAEFERYEVYVEGAGERRFDLVTYRKAVLVEQVGGAALRSVETFAKTVDPADCRSSDVLDDLGSIRNDVISEDQGVFLLAWRRFPLVVNLSHQSFLEPTGARTELWSLVLESQFPKAFPLSCRITWKK